ncbi:hypothetical protein LVY75_07370 (plasmid) [Sinorhizobium sp. B11]
MTVREIASGDALRDDERRRRGLVVRAPRKTAVFDNFMLAGELANTTCPPLAADAPTSSR